MTTPAPREWQRADYLVSTDPALLIRCHPCISDPFVMGGRH